MSCDERPSEHLAVIDLGSNSFRLVVFALNEDGSWRPVRELSRPVRIGEGVDRTGRLGRRPIERALQTIDAFASLCLELGLGPDAIDAVATSAIRDADNGAEFVERARAESGLSVRILSPGEEAHYGFLAAIGSTTLADGYVLDLGGGSLQVVRVAQRRARESASWRLGAVRMTERFLSGDGPATAGQVQGLHEHAVGQLTGADWLAGGGEMMVGLGGTIRTLAAAIARGFHRDGRAKPSPSPSIEREPLSWLIAELASMPVADRARLPGIKASRADLVLAGAVVVGAVLEATGFDRLQVTDAGLREGIFSASLQRRSERLLADRL